MREESKDIQIFDANDPNFLMTNPPTIHIAPDADALQHHAASELQNYLQRLFRLRTDISTTPPGDSRICFHVGHADAVHIRRVIAHMPDLSDQGHLVRRVDASTMVLAGGSSAAVAWAVYELVERYGVRYLLHEDVLPRDPGLFHLPDLNLVLEPLLALRCWRQFSELATGPAMWSLAQHQAFTRQLFKLKFNGILLALWPQQPFIDFAAGGIQRESACMLFDQEFPIDATTIGGERLHGMPLLSNPELAGAETYGEMLTAGRRLVGGILDQARGLGMQTALAMQPFEFPIEFQSLLDDPTRQRIQLGGRTCAERGDLRHPGHVALVQAHIAAYLEQWPGIDTLHLNMPEFPQAERTYRTCWEALNTKYDVEKVCPLDSLLAQSSPLTPGGTERAAREVKSAIAMLSFLDDFFPESGLIQCAAGQGTTVTLDLTVTSATLFPIIDRVVWPGAGIANVLDYTSPRAVRRMHHMEKLDTSRVRGYLDLTLQDDNGGWLPQVATHSIDLLVREMRRLGWHGFYTRCWPVGDLDPVVAHLARAGWDATASPLVACDDHFAHAFGPATKEELRDVMRMLEDATTLLDVDHFYLFFPILDIMCLPFDHPGPMPVALLHVRALYRQCRRVLERLYDKTTATGGDRRLAYMIGRLDFSIGALTEKQLLHAGHDAAEAARTAEDATAKARHITDAKEQFAQALSAGRAALTAMDRVAHDTDAACVIAYHHLFVRQVEERTGNIVAELEEHT